MMDLIFIVLSTIVLSEFAFVISYYLSTILNPLPIISVLLRFSLISKTSYVIHGLFTGFITTFCTCIVSFNICKSQIGFPFSFLIGLFWPIIGENEYKKYIHSLLFKEEIYHVKLIGRFHLAVRSFWQGGLHAYAVNKLNELYKNENQSELPDKSKIKMEVYKYVLTFMWNSFLISTIGSIIGILFVLELFK